MNKTAHYGGSTCKINSKQWRIWRKGNKYWSIRRRRDDYGHHCTDIRMTCIDHDAVVGDKRNAVCFI